MKNLFNLLSIMMISNFTIAQSYKIEYEERANINNQLKNVTDPETRKRVSAYLSKATTFYLYYKNGESLYIEEKEKIAQNEDLNIQNQSSKKIEIGKNGGGIYKNFKTKEYLHEADVLGKELLVVDKLNKIQWKLLGEEKTIGNYKCKNAVATINNEEITAWFTDEVALQDGPKDFYGLPGLIMELIAEKRHTMQSKLPKQTLILILKNQQRNQSIQIRISKNCRRKINELKRGVGNSLRN